MLEFKILNEPKQKFSVVLNRRRVTFLLWYSVVTDRWSITLSIDDVAVLDGRKIVTGRDLLAQFNFGIGIVFAFSQKGLAPNRDNLPNGNVKLYYTTQDEVDAAVSA